MLNRVRVLDGQVQAGDVFDVVRKRLDWALPSGVDGPETSFLHELWSWWYRTCVQLLARDRGRIAAMEVRRFVQGRNPGGAAGGLCSCTTLTDATSAVQATVPR
jgi:hypothetical protein